MELNKEDLEKRILELTELEKKYWAELNAILGAKKECFYWLKKIEENDRTTT